jgi:glucose-1-phosphate thymidylyltransferase
VFAKKVHDPERFGVVEFDGQNNVVSIEEKPESPKSEYAVVGIYIYDNNVINYAKSLQPSDRGEIEITDINNIYREKGDLKVELIEGIWEDAGTFDSLLAANNYWAKKAREGGE